MTGQNSFLDLVEKSNSKFKLQKPVSIKGEVLQNDGKSKIEEEEILVDRIFSPKKISKLMNEFYTNSNKLKNQVKEEDYENILEPYLMFLMVKHFSDVGEYFPVDLEKQINLMDKMIDTSTLIQIFTSFEEREIKKINEEIEISLSVFEANQEHLEEVKDEAKKYVKNQDLVDWKWIHLAV